MRILILNQAFYPDVVATAQYAAELAAYLAAQGHEVEVIAARRGWICLEGLFLALLLAALWLTYDGAHTVWRATQELVEWLLVPLSGVLLVQNFPGRVRGWRGVTG